MEVSGYHLSVARTIALVACAACLLFLCVTVGCEAWRAGEAREIRARLNRGGYMPESVRDDLIRQLRELGER